MTIGMTYRGDPLIKLMMGDCIDRMGEIEAGSVDLIAADLPYGTTACRWDAVIPFGPMWAAFERVLKSNGAAVLTSSQPFTSALVMSNPRIFKYEWIWKKNRASLPMVASFRPMPNHESILVYYRKAPTYNAQMGTGKSYRGFQAMDGAGIGDTYQANESRHAENHGTRYPKTVLDVPVEIGLHPTQKPVALFEYLIRTYSNEGETVLDCTMGSGTTGVACVNTNRSFIGIERDPDYFRIAESRIATAQSSMPLLSQA